jgi:hypothetical protein
VGYGPLIRFWRDLWCGDQLSKDTFLECFSIAICKEAWVADHVKFSNGNLQWDISFTR